MPKEEAARAGSADVSSAKLAAGGLTDLSDYSTVCDRASMIRAVALMAGGTSALPAQATRSAQR